MASQDPLLGFRLSDAVTLLTVLRVGSLSAAARELGVTVSQVSKALARLEHQLQSPLVERGPRGVRASPAGAALAPLLEQTLAQLREAQARRTELPALAVAAPLYVLAALARPLAQHIDDRRLRLLPLAVPEIRGRANDSSFEAAVLVGERMDTPGWEDIPAGLLAHALFAAPAVAGRLGATVDVDALKDCRFVMPRRASDGRSVTLDDGCPLPASKRRMGHEAETVALALELAAGSNQLVFAPVAAARALTAAGALCRIDVHGWNAARPLYLSVAIDRITTATRRALLRALLEVGEDATGAVAERPRHVAGAR